MRKKILTLFFSLWVVATGTFFLMHAVPGDPFIGDRMIPEEVLRSLHRHFGLDQPLWWQYIQYFTELLKGNLGPSIVYEGRSVNQLILEGLPVSARLGLQALLVAVPTGIFLGALAAVKRGSRWDSSTLLFSTLGISMPGFVLSSLLQYVFSVRLKWLPVALWGDFSHTILPTIALSLAPIAFIARLMRANMVEVLEQDYIQMARLKGLSSFQVLVRHGLRNALLPVLAYLGPISAQILTGSFVIEKIFAIPGLGQWLVQSISARDYPMIMGLTIFYSSLLMFVVFLVDVCNALLDPRLRKN